MAGCPGSSLFQPLEAVKIHADKYASRLLLDLPGNKSQLPLCSICDAISLGTLFEVRSGSQKEHSHVDGRNPANHKPWATIVCWLPANHQTPGFLTVEGRNPTPPMKPGNDSPGKCQQPTVSRVFQMVRFLDFAFPSTEFSASLEPQASYPLGFEVYPGARVGPLTDAETCIANQRTISRVLSATKTRPVGRNLKY